MTGLWETAAVTGSSLDELARRAAGSSDDGVAVFDYASALDGAGHEAEAIPVYRRALACDLADQPRYWATVQLGSSLRVTGAADEAVDVHQDALARWPRGSANRLFLALALLEADRPKHAVSEVLAVVLSTAADPDIELYRRALTTYAEQLG